MEIVKGNKESNWCLEARQIIKQLTIEEKIAQMMHQSPAIERLNIIAYNWWNESLHGVARAGTATVFPQAIGLGATFDETLLFDIATVIGHEGRAKFNMHKTYSDHDIYKGLTFWAPNVNIFRDPRWGRGHETYGEDPYLTSRLGVAYIKGLQQEKDGVMLAAACAKHYAVHSGPEEGRHSFDAKVSKQDLFESYLPAFKACVIEAKVEAVMGAYNRTNGEPCCGSKTLLQDILRDDWGFEGHVVSDCFAIKDFHEHHRVTAGPVESVIHAVEAGCDLNCGRQFLYLEQAVKEGRIDLQIIDKAIERLFITRLKLGVLYQDTKTGYDHLGFDYIDNTNHKALNIEAAAKGAVLLKNESLLPLDVKQVQTIGVIGPNANSRKALVGNYEGTASEYITVLDGIRRIAGDECNIIFSEGCHLYKNGFSSMSKGNDRLSEALAVCEASDVVIAVFGLDASLEGEEGDMGNQFASGDKQDLRLPGIQEDVLREIMGTGKPIILINLSGSAMALDLAHEGCSAIIQGWYPGAQGGLALAELIFGRRRFEGKLPVTFYSKDTVLPDFRSYAMEGRTYRYLNQLPLYPFGYGLTYGSAVVEKVKQVDMIDENIIYEYACTNPSMFDITETLQVYVEMAGSNESIVGPKYALKHFEKIHIPKMQKVTGRFKLAYEALSIYDANGELNYAYGDVKVHIGFSQPDRRSEILLGQKPHTIIGHYRKYREA